MNSVDLCNYINLPSVVPFICLFICPAIQLFSSFFSVTLWPLWLCSFHQTQPISHTSTIRHTCMMYIWFHSFWLGLRLCLHGYSLNNLLWPTAVFGLESFLHSQWHSVYNTSVISRILLQTVLFPVFCPIWIDPLHLKGCLSETDPSASLQGNSDAHILWRANRPFKANRVYIPPSRRYAVWTPFPSHSLQPRVTLQRRCEQAGMPRQPNRRSLGEAPVNYATPRGIPADSQSSLLKEHGCWERCPKAS